MDTFESYFDKLDEMCGVEERVKTCCELEENYCVSEGIIVCKSCNNVINNIVDTPEWRNYKSSGILHVVVCHLTIYYQNLL